MEKIYQKKQSNRTVNRGSNSRSINCCRITEIRAQSWSVISQMRLIESVVIIKIPTALYRVDKLFRMKGVEVERVKGIEPSLQSKTQWIEV